MISNERIAQLQEKIRRARKPDTERRRTLQVIDRLRVAEAALDVAINLCSNLVGYTPANVRENALRYAEEKLREEGIIR